MLYNFVSDEQDDKLKKALIKLEKKVKHTRNISAKKVYEYIKCKLSFKYFCENYVYIPEVGDDILLKPNEAQVLFYKGFFEFNNLVVNKSRQIGISTITQAIVLFCLIFYRNMVIGIVSRELGEAKKFVNKVQKMVDKLPSWLRPTQITNNKAEIEFVNNSLLMAACVNASKPEALFRGPTINLLVIDEGAFAAKIKEAFDGIKASTSRAQIVAKRKGLPFGTLVISTPNKTIGHGEWFYKSFCEAMNPESKYKALLLHWSLLQEYREDPEWYRNVCAEHKYDWDYIDQEYNCVFLPGLEGSIFSSTAIRRMNIITTKLKRKIERFKGFCGDLYIYENPDSRLVVIGIDTATATGKCYSAVQVVDFNTKLQLAEYKGKISFKKYHMVVEEILKMWPNCIIVPEYDTIGQSVCDYLEDSKWRDHIYRTPKKNIKGEIIRYFGGLYTHSQTRPKIIDAIYNNAVENPYIIQSARLKLELAGMKEAKAKTSKDGTDDLAMAWGFCLYVIDNGLYRDVSFYRTGYDRSGQTNNSLINTFIKDDFDINEIYFGKNYEQMNKLQGDLDGKSVIRP